jgi:hypothetical protein
MTVDSSARTYLSFWPLLNGTLLAGGDTGLYEFTGQQVAKENFSMAAAITNLVAQLLVNLGFCRIRFWYLDAPGSATSREAVRIHFWNLTVVQCSVAL